MESGKKEEAGPSRGVVNAEEKKDKQREMKTEKPLTISEVLLADEDEEEEYDDEDVKEGDGVVAGFSPGPLVSLKEQIEKDKLELLSYNYKVFDRQLQRATIVWKLEDDDSLRRWKEKLLGCVEGDLNGQMEPEVKFHSIGIISDDFGEITTPLPIDKNQNGHVLFTLKEGSRFQLKLTFNVMHNIVSGLTYSNTVWKAGLQVDQSKGMLGTFAPQREPYVHTLEEETTPSGVLARGLYSAKLKFEDDDRRWDWLPINLSLFLDVFGLMRNLKRAKLKKYSSNFVCILPGSSCKNGMLS
ncbi:Rho GDP-dissociation inhibitor 1 [Citrus sinensis]|uniref:Rho GDP-dissociation inhibitor 1 n=1 Tax=Citrus sinensis TaxID=2711 RepID=A0ACB8MI63_CITSI|nr:Rho GDP-dissociation inhibitor 1 [Citrus sinensis]